MSTDNRTDEQIAREAIFGVAPQSQEVETEVVTEEQPREVEVPAAPEQEQHQVVDPVITPAEQFDMTKISDDKVLELLNTKFSVNFDTLESVTDFIQNQKSFRGQEQIITKLTEKLKESSNVLSHFPSENAYKVAKLVKDKYPDKEMQITRIIGSDVEKMSDFEAISLAEALNRPAGSKVDPLRLKLARLGLKDSDVSDFENWDQDDKELIYAEAEDARVALQKLQNEVVVPQGGDQGVLDYLSEIERGVQESKAKQDELAGIMSPIANSLVKNMTKIKPVDGEDFEYAISLDNESAKQLEEFILAEAMEGGYNIHSDKDIKALSKMLETEIWATDGPKIMKAFGEYKEQKTWEQARIKYENAEPLKESVPSSAGKRTAETDNDRARRLLEGR